MLADRGLAAKSASFPAQGVAASLNEKAGLVSGAQIPVKEPYIINSHRLPGWILETVPTVGPDRTRPKPFLHLAFCSLISCIGVSQEPGIPSDASGAGGNR